MEIFFASSLDTLYFVLTIAIGMVAVFLCVALLYLTLVLRDAEKILDKVRDTADKVNAFVVKPVQIAAMVVDRVRPIIESVFENRSSSSSKRKKK
ncbi:MAG: hypothetical protein AAB592_03745 [Patescibacteria group bacterium]